MASEVPTDPAALRAAVLAGAEALVSRAPGRAVEVRVPGPIGTAFQCVAGPPHKRGTPGSVVETDPVTFVELVTGRVTWAEARATGRLHASGEHADLSPYLPILA